MGDEIWAERCNAIDRVARTPRCDLLLRYMDLESATGSNGAVWSAFQVKTFNETATLASYNKSRQIGMSFTLAGGALAEAILTPRHTTVMVSYNIEEAKEKIIYGKAYWESRHPKPYLVPARGEFDASGVHQGKSPCRVDRWPELIKSNALEMVFDNGSRLISHPSRPPRGKSASVIADEAAHCLNFNGIFVAALPMITRGENKRLEIASTPLGASGRWWEIHTDAKKYPDFARHDFGWWEIGDLCRDPNRCRYEFSRGMDPEELVRRFGTQKMRLLFANMLLEDYLQEYSLSFLDSIHSFLPWDLIKSCYPPELLEAVDRREAAGTGVDVPDDEYYDGQAILREERELYFYALARCKPGVPDRGLDAVRDLAEWIRRTNPDGAFGWAYDVGRDRDCSEITVFQFSHGRRMQRLLVTMPQLPFDEQETILFELLRSCPLSEGLIDKGGPGRQVAERLFNRFGERAMPVWFTPENKDKWAVELKKSMQRRVVTLIPDRDQEQQLHSIRRDVGESSKTFRYIVEESSSTIGGGKKVKHHADKFWAVAMGVYLGHRYDRGGGSPPVTGDKSSTVQANREVAKRGQRTTKAAAIGAAPRSVGSSRAFTRLRGQGG